MARRTTRPIDQDTELHEPEPVEVPMVPWVRHLWLWFSLQPYY